MIAGILKHAIPIISAARAPRAIPAIQDTGAGTDPCPDDQLSAGLGSHVDDLVPAKQLPGSHRQPRKLSVVGAPDKPVHMGASDLRVTPGDDEARASGLIHPSPQVSFAAENTVYAAPIAIHPNTR